MHDEQRFGFGFGFGFRFRFVSESDTGSESDPDPDPDIRSRDGDGWSVVGESRSRSRSRKDSCGLEGLPNRESEMLVLVVYGEPDCLRRIRVALTLTFSPSAGEGGVVEVYEGGVEFGVGVNERQVQLG